MKRRPLSWTPSALTDLEEIEAYIAADDPIAAERWAETLMETAGRASELPFSGRVVPELEREDIREVLKRSYRIIYRILEDRVEVLAVIEGHRRLPTDLLERGPAGSE